MICLALGLVHSCFSPVDTEHPVIYSIPPLVSYSLSVSYLSVAPFSPIFFVFMGEVVSAELIM